MPDPGRPPLPPGTILTGALLGLLFAASAAIHPVMDEFIRRPFRLDNAESSAFPIANVAATLLFSPLAGYLADRTRRGDMLVGAGLIGAGLLYAVFPWVPSFRLLLFLRFLQGACDTTAMVLLMAKSLELAAEGSRGRIMAVVMTAVPVGYLAGGLLGGVVGAWSVTAMFSLLGGALVVAGLVAARAGNRPVLVQREASMRCILRVAVGTPRLWLPYAFGFADRFAFGAFAVLPTFFLGDLMGVHSPATVSLLTVAPFWLGFLVLLPLSARVIDRVGTMPPLLLGSLAFGVTMTALGAAPLAGSSGPAAFAATMAACGMACAIMYVPGQLLVGERCRADQRAAAMGAFNALGTIGMVAGMAACAIASKHSYALAFALAGSGQFACVGGALLARLLARGAPAST